MIFCKKETAKIELVAKPVDNYETACDFVKIDVSVQDKISGQTKLSQFCNTVAQHQNQYEHAGEIETLSCKKSNCISIVCMSIHHFVLA